MKISVWYKSVVCFLLLLQSFGMSQMAAKNSSESHNDIVGAVYIATNAPPLDQDGNPQYNSVLMFHRHRDGLLTPVPGSPFSTLGQGAGPGFELPPDPIGSQGSLIVDKKNKFLFVVNCGSNEISSFKIHKNRLEHISTVSSGGQFPNSLTIFDDVLYVVNSAGTFNVSGFKVSKQGFLMPLCSGRSNTCELLPPINEAPIVGDNQPIITIVPGQIGFSPDGKQLIVIRKEGVIEGDPFAPLAGPGRIDVYNLNDCKIIDCNNVTSNINTRVPNGRFPFSFVFSKQGYMLVSEVAGVPGTPPGSIIGASAVSSYKLKSNGKLRVISADVPDGGSAACWNVVAGKFMYVNNNLSNSLALYEAHKDGTLELINPSVVTLSPDTAPAFPLDMSVTSDERFLYLLSEGVEAAIYVLAIDKHTGGLTLLQTVNVGEPFAGFAGLAISDFK